MDTEFPDVIFKADHRRLPSDHYHILNANVDALNLIQLGLTLADPSDNLPSPGIWQFNFSYFDVAVHPHAPESIELLHSHGIDFDANRSRGIDSAQFAELMMGLGMVCNYAVSWITFHSTYDFGYLVKVLTGKRLPAKEF